MFKWRMKATNAIYLEDNFGVEGRPFKARFLQAGLVKYDFGVCLLKKETIDKFINTFVGTPVIIDHKDDITEGDKVGVINKIWFSAEDGWFWCSGILTDEKAVKLIEDGYNVSCQYRITEYADNTEGKFHNANPYDKEILDGVFEHLAIVENPRYEDAFIAVNAYIACNEDENMNNEDDIEWITVKGTHIPIKEGQSKEKAIKEFWENAKEKQENKDIEQTTTEHKEFTKWISSILKHHKGKFTEKEAKILLATAKYQLNSPKGLLEKQLGISLMDLEYQKLKKDLKKFLEMPLNDLYELLDKSYKKAFKEQGRATNEFQESENPHYEDAFIAYIAANKEFNEEDHPRDDEGKFSETGDYFKNWEDAPEIELKSNELSAIEDPKELRKAAESYYKSNLQGKDINHPELGNIRISGKGWKEFVHTSADIDKLKAVPQIPEILTTGKLGKFQPDYKGRKDNIKGFYPIYTNLKTEKGTKKAEALIGQDNEGNLFYTMFLDYDRPVAQNKRDITSNQDRLPLNFIISHSNVDFNPNVTINKASNKFQKVFDYICTTKGEPMDNETKGIFNQLLDALKARNEAEEKKEDKKDPKASNEDIDKRKLIDEVGGILKGKVDEEVWRTIIGKIEKVAYDKSEAGTADNGKAKNEDAEATKKAEEEKKEEEEAKNKCRNEEEKRLYEELKEKVEKDAENKAKNSFDEAVNRLYSALAPEADPYVDGIELGNIIYGK